MVRQSDRAVKHASYADYLFMVSAEAGVPTRVQKPPEYFLLARAFFFPLIDSRTSVHL